MAAPKVFPNIEPIAKGDFAALIAPGISRAVAAFGLNRLALHIGAGCDDTLTNAMRPKGIVRADLLANIIQAAPELHTDLFDRLGFEPCPTAICAAPDADLLAALAALLAAHAEAMRDGRRDHRETRTLAGLIRPLLPWLRSIVREADAP